ncbi:hypothetical protein E5Q_01864, partial [Mixia osmundae IAM 14324]
ARRSGLGPLIGDTLQITVMWRNSEYLSGHSQHWHAI